MYRHRTVFVKLVQLFALLLKPLLFEQSVATIPKSLVRLVGVPPRKTIHLLEKVSLLQLRNVSDFKQKRGVQLCGFWRTQEVEHDIVLNREKRLEAFDLFRALHLFDVGVELHFLTCAFFSN